MDTYNASDIKYAAMSLLGRTDKPNFVTSTEPDVQKINFLYPQIMYHTLQRYRWGFARQYAELTKSNVTGGRYKNNFTLPSDFIYLRGCYSDNKYKATIRERELNTVDNVINTDSETCFIEYIKVKLAFDACMDVTGDTELLQVLDRREQFEYINATNIDARQQRVKEVDTGVFIDVRR